MSSETEWPGSGEKNTHNWIELSERDCEDRNRPAEVDLSGSGGTLPVEKSGGGGIRLSKHRAGAAAEAHRESREEGGVDPLKTKWRKSATTAWWSAWPRLPSRWLHWRRHREGGNIWSLHSCTAAHQNNVEAIAANCVLMAPFPVSPSTNWQKHHLHWHTREPEASRTGFQRLRFFNM